MQRVFLATAGQIAERSFERCQAGLDVDREQGLGGEAVQAIQLLEEQVLETGCRVRCRVPGVNGAVKANGRGHHSTLFTAAGLSRGPVLQMLL